MNYSRWLASMLVLFVVPSLLGGTPAVAQDAVTEALHEAENLLQQNQDGQAIAVLDSLFETDPGNHRVYLRLRNVLSERGEHQRAIEVATRHLETSDPTASGYAEKGRLLHQAGEVSRANEAWEKALSLDPDDLSTYQAVYRAMIDVQRFGQAAEVIFEAREQLNQPDAFEHELPYLLAAAGRYDEAGREYALAVRSNPNRIGFVQNRIRPFFERDDARPHLLTGVREAVEEYDQDPALRSFIAWLYTQDDQFEKALESTIAADQLGPQDGTAVYEFAVDAMEAGAFAEAINALKHLEDHYETAEFADEVPFLLGDSYAAIAETAGSESEEAEAYEEAIASYDRYIERGDHGDYLAAALQKIGEIQLHHLGDLTEATKTLERVRAEIDDPAVVSEAELTLARAALQRGAFDEAEKLLAAAATSPDQTLARRAILDKARLAMLQGDFESALNHANAASSDPSADDALEAIRLRMLLVENKHAPDSTALIRYAEAEMKHRRGEEAEARRVLLELIDNFPDYPLADDARLLHATYLFEAGKTDEAREAFLSLAQDAPGSPVADQGLYEAARLYEQDDPEFARELYMDLLRTYPASLHAPDARERARDLQNE